MKDSETVSKLIIEKLISNVIYAEKSNIIADMLGLHCFEFFSTRVFILLSHRASSAMTMTTVIERKKKLLPSMIIKEKERTHGMN